MNMFPQLSKDGLARLPFAFIESYYGTDYKHQLVRHQIESFNYFIRHQLPGTVEQFNPIIIPCDDEYDATHNCYKLQIYIYLENVKVGLPIVTEPDGSLKPMYPAEACLRNFAYGSKVTVDMRVQYHIRRPPLFELEIIPQVFHDVILCNRMPIMVRSECCRLSQPSFIDPRITGECTADCGGYFIIKGSEKTVLAQVYITENQVHTFYDKSSSSSRAWYAEIRSAPPSKFISPKTLDMFIYSKENALGTPIYVTIPRIKTAIPLYVLFRYYGACSDKYITEFIVYDVNEKETTEVQSFLAASMLDASMCMTTDEAIASITEGVYYVHPDNQPDDPQTRREKKIEYVRNIMQTDCLPHCTTSTQKLIMLGTIARQLILTRLGHIPVTDRDSYKHKRICTAGGLINNLFRTNYNQMVKIMKKAVKKEMKMNHWKASHDYRSIITDETIPRIVKSSIIENGIKRPLSSGDFSMRQSATRKVGVAQVLSRLTFAATISHSRRVNSHVSKSGEMIEPRKVNPTSWGYICPVESPEGECIGVVNNICCLAHITLPSETKLFPNLLAPHLEYMVDTIIPQLINHKHSICNEVRSRAGNSEALSPSAALFLPKMHELVTIQLDKYCIFPVRKLANRVSVYVNNVYMGIAKQARQLFHWLKTQKVAGVISIYASIIFDYKDRKIHICTEGGRLTRPVLRLVEGVSLVTDQVVNDVVQKKIRWEDLLISVPGRPAVIEYIDPEEQNISLIAMTPTVARTSTVPYTHCEIHPSVIFGVLASCIPFPEHNQSPRNTYQCAMGKQSMGVYALNHDMRMDKSSYFMSYAGRPLVSTRFMDIARMNKTPSGTQIIIAIASYTGYNQEDSVIMNKSAIDRGLFSASIFHTEKDEEKSQQDSFIRTKPDPEVTRGMRFGKLGKYDKLNSNGFVPEGTLVENNDIIIGKVIRTKKPKGNNLNEEVLYDHFPNHKYEDHSKKIRTHEPVYIYKNCCGRNGDNYNFAVVQTLTYRKPKIGDKFTSRQAQKGTAGLILPEEDMPFTADGIKPDIILNPHAIPSRMTIAYMMEVLMGKVLVEEGKYGDGTFHSDQSITDIAKDLQTHGYQSHGNELMYNGMTGEQMEVSIFTGPIYYQRLKHMVNDKMHAREMGPPVSLTRQPMEGRSRDGGFRIGEMERDVLISHGATALCLDRLMNVSDKYFMWCCKACGGIASVNTGAPPNVFMSEKTRAYSRPIYLCKMCGNTTRFARVCVPYACKLFFQELEVANVLPRLITE